VLKLVEVEVLRDVEVLTVCVVEDEELELVEVEVLRDIEVLVVVEEVDVDWVVLVDVD